MAQLVIDLSGRAGLAPRFWGDTGGTVAQPGIRYLGQQGQLADGVYNPLRRYGYISPVTSIFTDATTASGTISNIIGSSLYDPVNDDLYFAERGRYLWHADGFGDTSVAQDVDLGASTTIHDLDIYQVNGAKKLFVVYKNAAGNMDIAISNLPYDTGSDDLTWLTATVSGSFTNALTNDAFMRVASNGFAYLFEDNNIHKIDGTSAGGANGTITPSVILFPSYWQMVDAIDYRNNIFVCIHESTEAMFGASLNTSVENIKAGVYIWDRISSISQLRDYIPVNNVKQIRKIYTTSTGELRIIVINSQNLTEIRRYNGSSFDVVAEFGQNAHPGFHDGLISIGNLEVWLGSDGNIYGHGKITANDNDGIYKLGNLTSATSSTLPTGAILYGGGTGTVSNLLYLGIKTDAGTDKIQIWDIFGKQIGTAVAYQEVGNIYTLVQYLPQMSTIKDIYVVMARFATSGTTTQATMTAYFNGDFTGGDISKSITRDDIEKGYKRIEINKPYINAIQLYITYATDVAIGAATDFCPAFAIIEYEPTGSKG